MKQIKIPRILTLFVIVFNAGIATVASANFEFNPAPLISSNGQLRGAVLLSGTYQAPAPLKVVKSRSFCGLTVPNETLLVDRGGGVRNAVVILRPLDRNVNIHPGRILLDNKQCAFTPHVQIAGIGSELLLKNSDPILHTVHARLGNEDAFQCGFAPVAAGLQSSRPAGCRQNRLRCAPYLDERSYRGGFNPVCRGDRREGVIHHRRYSGRKVCR